MTLIIYRRNREKGAASLLTALILLICITLVVLLTAKTVLVETQITADNYRTSQATAAASAAMNQGVAYFIAGGIDQNNDGTVDFLVGTPSTITLTSGAQQTSANFYFNNTPGNGCECAAGNCLATTNMTKARIIAQGWSDDGVATRTISQCLTTFRIFAGGQGPEQPFVGRESVGVLGNARIINRYSNSTIWAGGDMSVSGASFGTYLRPSNTLITDYTTTELNDADETATDTGGDPTQQRVSDRDSGIGIDVITNDPTLGNKTPDQLFDMFFSANKAKMMAMADGVSQKFAVGTDVAATAPNASGIVWIGDDSATPSTTDTTVSTGDEIGSTTNPVIMIVNGDFKMTGGIVHGVIYVMGELIITGNPIIKGSVVSENGDSSGNGTLNLVYVPYGSEGNTNPPFILGTGAVLAGSWADWVGN